MFKNIFKVVTKEVINGTDNAEIIKITKSKKEAENTALSVASKYQPLLKKVDEDGSTYTGTTKYGNKAKVEVWDENTLLGEILQ